MGDGIFMSETLILNKRKIVPLFVLQRYFETVKLPFKTGRHLTWVCEQRLSAKLSDSMKPALKTNFTRI